MTTVIDTNIFIALWDQDERVNRIAQKGLKTCFDEGRLVVTAPVFAELMAFPSRTEHFLENFFRDTDIAVDWLVSEAVWRAAGVAFQGYAKRRRKEGSGEPRRILADFLIGAYAEHHQARILTLDQKIYRAAFPNVPLVKSLTLS